MAEEEVKTLADAQKWPMPERIAHANWKVRSAAYEDIRTACQAVYEETDPCLNEYAPLFGKAVADSNAAALDKALDALNIFLSKATEQHAAKCAERTCSGIVGKCLNGRAGTVQRATESMMLFIELEQADKVVEALIGGFSHKIPKVVVAALEIMVAAVGSFGPKVVPPQPILKSLRALFDSKDGKARDKVKELVVELSRWVGADLIRSSLFKDMRDAMKDDIEKAMQAVASTGKPKPERLTRKEQAKPQVVVAAVEEEAVEEKAEETEAAAEVDPYEFAEPKDILKELKKEFWEGLESKKWSDRKGALTQLKEAASFPRLACGRDVDYGDVNRELRKVITKDSNVACVAEAILCTGALAQGLRGAYSNVAKGLVEVLLEKLKEKNAAVGKAVAESLTVMHKHCFGMLDITEYVIAALGHQNPKVKEETLNWLRDAVRQEEKPNLSKLAPQLLPVAAKCAEEAAPSLREAALAFMVSFAAKFGNSAVLDKFTAKLDDVRKKKLEEMVAEAMGGGKPAGPSGAAAAAAARAGPPSPAARAPPTARPSAAAAALASTRGRPGSSSMTRQSLVGATSKASAPAAGGKKAADKPAGKGGDNDDETSLSSSTISKDEVLGKFQDLFGEATVKALQDEVWKTRLDAMEEVLKKASDGSLNAQVSVLVQGMQYLPGWNEKNFQVMGKQFELIKVMASNAPNLTKADAFVAMGGLVEKVSDVKLRGPSFDALFAISEAVGPQFVVNILHKKAVNHKNPKVLSEVINWMAQAIEEFGLPQFNVKSLLDWMKEDLGSANAAVRNSAINLLGAMHRFLGPPLAEMIRNDVKPALMTAIDEKFARNPKDPSLAPIRVSRVEAKKPPAKSAADGPPSKGGAAPSKRMSEAFDADDLLPREDISGSITSALLGNLTSSNWKDRKQGLDDVEQLLLSACNRIQPQVGDLMGALKQRMADSNKNLTSQALQLVGKLAKAMGKAIDRIARPVLAPALKNLSDNKPTVRAAVVEMLDAWASVAPVDTLMDELIDAVASPKSTADGKADAINWLATLAASGKLDDSLPQCLRAVAIGSGDKSASPREAAGKLIVELIQAYSVPTLGQIVGSLVEPPVRKAVNEAIQKASGVALPASASAPAAAPSLSRSASVRTSVSKPSSASASLLRSSTSKLGAAGVRSSLSLNKSVNLGGSMGGSGQMDGPLLLQDTKKEDRAKKGKYRPAKLELRPDEASTLEAELSPLVSAQLKALLFPKDPKDFKKHCEAADNLLKALPTMYSEIMGVLDLLFRWSTLRIVESNTQVLVKLLDLLKSIFDAMIERGDQLSEYEVKLVLPAVVEKAGHNQDKIKADHKELIKRVSALYPAPKALLYVKDGLESKNNKTRVVCAEEIGALIDRDGTGVCRANKQVDVLGSVARLVSERDSALRNAALDTLAIVYSFEGDGVWKSLGKLSDAQKSLIEQRLKATDKVLASKGLRAGYRGGADTEPELDANAKPMTPRGSGPASPGGRQSPVAKSMSLQSGISSQSILGNNKSSIPGAASYHGQSYGGSSILDAPRGVSDSMGGLPRPPSGNLSSSMMIQPSAPALNQQSPIASLSKASVAEMKRDFQRCMETLAGPDMESSVQVMKLFCYEVMDGNNSASPSPIADLFRENLDPLLQIMNKKTDLIFREASEAIQAKHAPNQRALKYSLNTLMNIFQNDHLATDIKQGTLHGLVVTLLNCMVDQYLASLPEGQAMLKALNMLMMKILDNCDKTDVFCAFLQQLLNPQLRNQNLMDEQRYLELVVKCMIKLTKILPQYIETMDLSHLLLAIHNFFQELGREEISRRGARDDKPLRMVKTLLHEICKQKGHAIYNYTADLPGANLDPANRPIIFPYIDLNLTTINPDASRAQQRGLRPGDPPAAGSMLSRNMPAQRTQAPPSLVIPNDPTAPPSNALALNTSAFNTGPLSGSSIPSPKPQALALQPSSGLYAQPAPDTQVARNILAAIFKRIADKDQQALVDLHYFMEHNPKQELDVMLSSASQHFKTYITRGLYKVRNAMQQAAPPQQQQRLLNEDAAPDRTWGSPDADAVSTSEGGAARDGMTSSSAVMTAADRLARSSSNGHISPASPGLSKSRVGTANIEALRDRLKNVQHEYTQLPISTRSSVTSLGGIGPSSSILAPALAPAPAPAPQPAAGVSSSMQELQERMRRLQ